MCVQPEFSNYNVKTIGFPGEQWDWCEKQHYRFRVFINSDGGGYNHHTVEFQSLEHARAFILQFSITGPRCLYAEDTTGHIHYLNNEPQTGEKLL
jgi:hypothetical protein